MSDETYGGITRSSAASSYYPESGGGVLTIEIWKRAFTEINKIDKALEQREHDFYVALRPFMKLLDDDDLVGYWAAYRLVLSAFYMEACLHPKNYAKYVSILTERGLWPIPIDSTASKAKKRDHA
jgi:hypothetical protein